MKKYLTILAIVFLSLNSYGQDKNCRSVLPNELLITLSSDVKNIDNLVNFVWVDDGDHLYYPDNQKFVDNNTISFWFNEDLDLKGKNFKLMYYSEETGILTYDF